MVCARQRANRWVLQEKFADPNHLKAHTEEHEHRQIAREPQRVDDSSGKWLKKRQKKGSRNGRERAEETAEIYDVVVVLLEPMQMCAYFG